MLFNIQIPQCDLGKEISHNNKTVLCFCFQFVLNKLLLVDTYTWNRVKYHKFP